MSLHLVDQMSELSSSSELSDKSKNTFFLQERGLNNKLVIAELFHVLKSGRAGVTWKRQDCPWFPARPLEIYLQFVPPLPTRPPSSSPAFLFCIFMGIGDNERILGSSLLYSQLVIIDDDDSGWWWKLHMLNVIRATFVSNTDDTRPHFSASSAIIFLLLKMMVMIMLVFVELNGKVKITLRIQQIYFLN